MPKEQYIVTLDRPDGVSVAKIHKRIKEGLDERVFIRMDGIMFTTQAIKCTVRRVTSKDEGG